MLARLAGVRLAGGKYSRAEKEANRSSVSPAAAVPASHAACCSCMLSIRSCCQGGHGGSHEDGEGRGSRACCRPAAARGSRLLIRAQKALGSWWPGVALSRMVGDSWRGGPAWAAAGRGAAGALAASDTPCCVPRASEVLCRGCSCRGSGGGWLLAGVTPTPACPCHCCCSGCMSPAACLECQCEGGVGRQREMFLCGEARRPMRAACGMRSVCGT